MYFQKFSNDFRAQASLEYMLIFAAALSFLGVFVFAGTNLTEAGIFFLEAKNGKQFMDSFDESLKEISVFSQGTSKEIYFSGAREFELNASGNKIALFLVSKGKTKSFEFLSSVDVKDFSFEGKNELSLLLINEGNYISVEKT